MKGYWGHSGRDRLAFGVHRPERISQEDARVFRDFTELVANSPDTNMNEANWRALRADARNRLDVAAGGRLSNDG